ncbi:hypothetical protein CFC21_008069 [Triticum aestivum]|uniref:Uncharacterized protein n=2 Tax=Triticum aestivum TaxID=4565 RepID=A0A9R1DFE4_WHEAT|nr:uncharacterized protein LOC123095615 [Triticum aestivum]XP_044373090.1 uncharacterized protein LOC123095625 [Triticum aestivum]XP_044373102.1 uncharacterized protein LOC123095634 [Triticum aestivum]KAF6990922.1 hypothetical protein CFC21_008067 [Triticum aestivum]KAF6990923.1 hypothetical protein CFC21_008068 [Triticum aestivum]KAF6990924.1 hypothetical protein CFC21_008069 [Triticum aestivum]
MAPTPSFLFGAAPEDTPAADMSAHAMVPDLSDAVARARLRRQAASGPGRQQAASRGGALPRKTPQRGLGVAELERLRCGGVDPLRDLNSAAAAAMLEAAAANLQAQGNSVVLQHHHDYLPAFDAATGSRYYSPLLVQPPPAPPAPQPQPQAPVRYVQGMAPEQQYFMDRWDRMGGFVPAGSGHQPQLQVPAPECPSSQSTIWRPACSSASCGCLHAGQRCDLCSKMMVAMADRGTRSPATATANAPYYSIYDLAATMAMTAACKETTGQGFLAPEGRKEVREIEFFPTRVTSHGGPDESELRRKPPSSSWPSGGVGGSLDLSLRL